MQECTDTLAHWIQGTPRRPCSCTACYARSTLIPRFPGLFQLTVSPDRSRVAFVNVLQEGSELWTARSNGSDSRRLCLSDAFQDLLFPRFDLVGAGLYFSVDGNGSRGIRWIGTRGGTCTEITSGRDWGPYPIDPRHIVYLHLTGQKKGHLVLLDLLRRRPRRLTSRVGAYGVIGYEPPYLITVECKDSHGQESASLLEFNRIKLDLPP